MSLRKIWLNVNGANRMFVCNPEKDSLATVLRRAGLTGVKVGCNAGQCGSCSVILDDEVVRSCVKKIKNIPDYANITTIEGVGTPTSLHPLQQAFITYGAVQCGFCSPGFIVSAKALLDKNPDPTRQEVRDWFTKHRNLCRCTGYKPIVDAVMAAAKVLRGEWTMEDITYKIPADGKIYGTKFPRRETGVSRVTGMDNYGDDIALQMPEGTLHLAIVQPDVAHAKIKGIDYSAALKMPGVVNVITAKDVKGTNWVACPVGNPRSLAQGSDRPVINGDKIFRYGDIVAVVAADTRENARAAVKAVKVDLELLPAYLTVPEATMPDAVRVHEESDNLYLEWPIKKGEDTRKVLDSSEFVAEGSFYSTREPHLVIEPDVAQGYFDEDGLLTIHCKGQTIHDIRYMISPAIGIDPEQIRVIENATGGSFGYAMAPGTAAVIATCVQTLNAPVSLTMSYPEHQHWTGKRAPANANIRLGCDKEGKITGLEYQMVYDHGAYSDFTNLLIAKALLFIGFPYSVPNIRGIIGSAFTNANYATTYRAFASVQSFTPSESIVDMLAEKAGIDPFEFRYKNIARPGDLTANQYPYPDYPMVQLMDMMKPKYDAAVARAKAESTDKKKRGVGIACGGYITSLSVDVCFIDLELCPDGSIIHWNSWEDQGQCSEPGALLHTYEALRPLGIPMDKIRTIQNDTKYTPATGMAAGSRSHYMVGNATIDAANKLMDAMRKPDGTYRTYDEMVAEEIPTKYQGFSDHSAQNLVEYDLNDAKGDCMPSLMYQVFMTEVEVDTETGKTKVLSYKVCADIGTVGNVLSVEGQAYGGMAHGIGMALREDYSDFKKHATLAGAGILECDDIPDDVEILFLETPRKFGPYGSSGCAESFQSAPHCAVLNAINNAVGVRIYEMPALPEKVKAAMEAKTKGKCIKPDKYYLGGDLFDKLDEMAEKPVYWTESGEPVYGA